jgi:2-amino-4-hydroxy-6-hydroxymethyldihydropteridine diphosphokinase
VTRAFLGLGSNLGDRLAALERAVSLLDAHPGVRVLRSSRVYETAPVGPPQPDYLNAVIEVETSLSAPELLAACQDVEGQLARVREERWGPRTLDIDVLTYGDEVIDEPGLQVPHPRMHERGFVLAPLLELTADPPLPGGRRIATLRLDVAGLQGVRPFAPALYSGSPASSPASSRSLNIARTSRREPRLTTVALIGAGRVGTAFGALLERAGGYRVVAVSGRRASHERAQRYLPFARFLLPEDAAKEADVAVFGVPDDLIAKGCEVMASNGAFRRRQRVLHLSGSIGLDALAPAKSKGAEILSVHPLMTVPEVEAGIERLPGSPMAVTATTEAGFGFGEGLVQAVGGEPFRLPDEAKPLYHAAAVFASNYLVVVEALAEELLRTAGVEDAVQRLTPLARASLDRALELGPSTALTGPAARGDVGTLARNLKALGEHAPHMVPAYWMLARQAARIAHQAGRLSTEGRDRIEEVLGRARRGSGAS